MKLSFASTHFFLLFPPKLLLHVSHGIGKILIFSFYSFVRIKKLSKSNKLFVHTTRHRERAKLVSSVAKIVLLKLKKSAGTIGELQRLRSFSVESFGGGRK